MRIKFDSHGHASETIYGFHKDDKEYGPELRINVKSGDIESFWFSEEKGKMILSGKKYQYKNKKAIECDGGGYYVGEFKGGVRCGQGFYLSTTGKIYEGGFRNSKRHGYGRISNLYGKVLYHKREWGNGAPVSGRTAPKVRSRDWKTMFEYAQWLVKSNELRMPGDTDDLRNLAKLATARIAAGATRKWKRIRSEAKKRIQEVETAVKGDCVITAGADGACGLYRKQEVGRHERVWYLQDGGAEIRYNEDLRAHFLSLPGRGAVYKKPVGEAWEVVSSETSLEDLPAPTMTTY